MSRSTILDSSTLMAWRRGTKPAGWHARRGEVFLIDLDKERPALVISSDSLNAHSLDVCIVPISSAERKAFSLRPKLMAGEAGLKYDWWVKCDQTTTVEKNLVVYPPLGVLSPASMQKVEAAVKVALELK